MQAVEVHAVLADLERAGCRAWVAAGSGVDALVGRQTRGHRDLDLAVDARQEAPALAALLSRGYRVETDRRPVRLELEATGRGWVDLNPVVFDAAGHRRQSGLDGGVFHYPAGAFTEGRLDGTRAPCLTRKQQVLFRNGYQPRDVDRHDLRLMEDLGA